MFQKDLFILDGTFLDMNNNTDPNLSAIDPIDDYKVIDGQDCIVIPGFIHTNLKGAYGIDFSDIELSFDDLDFVTENLVKMGITSFCPCVSPHSYSDQIELLSSFKEYKDKQTHDRIKGAQMIGVHLNNPIFPDLYLSTPSVETNSLQHKRPSQMNIGSKQMLSDSSSVSTNSRHDAVARQNELHPSMLFEDIHITTVNQQSSLTTEQILASIHRTLDPFTDLLSMISISPDLFFRRELIQFCKEYSIAICIDDNDCSLSNAEEALQAGVSCILNPFLDFTSPLDGQSPLYTLLSSPVVDTMRSKGTEILYSLTSDPYYMHPSLLSLIAKIGINNCILETSPSIYVGLDDGIFTYQDKKIMVDHGTIYDLHSNQYIEAILSLPIEFAIHCASVNPSKLLQLTHKKGTLDNGLDADMVFLDSNFNVVSTYIQGKQVYRIPYMAE